MITGEMFYRISMIYSIWIASDLFCSYIPVGIQIWRIDRSEEVLGGIGTYIVYFIFLLANILFLVSKLDAIVGFIILPLTVLFLCVIFIKMDKRELEKEREKLSSVKRRIVYLLLMGFSYTLTMTGYVLEVALQ